MQFLPFLFEIGIKIVSQVNVLTNFMTAVYTCGAGIYNVREGLHQGFNFCWVPLLLPHKN